MCYMHGNWRMQLPFVASLVICNDATTTMADQVLGKGDQQVSGMEVGRDQSEYKHNHECVQVSILP